MNPPLKIFLRARTLFLVFFFTGITVLAYGQNGPDTTPLYYPYAEWTIEHSGYSGNPFDIVATVTFTHTNSGEQRTTEMFYDGDWDWETQTQGSVDEFKFRFSGTRLGEWTYSTSSDEAALDGLSGSIEVVEQSDQTLARGFIGKSTDNGQAGRKWIWRGNGEALIPNIVMRGYTVQHYNDNSNKIDNDITEFIDQHGFNGFLHQIAYSWFDPTTANSNDISNVDSPALSPSPQSFEIIENTITSLYEAGAYTHLWEWGSGGSTGETNINGGVNSAVHQRLQRYIAARLGPLPGWTLGFGWDVWTDMETSDLNTWHSYYESINSYNHIIGARAHRNDIDPDSYGMTVNTDLDYKGHEDHETINHNGNLAYNRWINWLTEYPNLPHFSEDRFRQDDYSSGDSRDFTDDRSRITLWQSAMVGGIGTIWGQAPYVNSVESDVFDNKAMFKVFSNFWTDRFTVDLLRDNSITDGYALTTPSKDRVIFYKEDTGSIDMDLTGVTIESAIAVDTREASYDEIDISSNLTSDSQNTWTAPGNSDWVISINGSSDGSDPPDSPPTIDDITTTATTAEVSYSEASSADSYEYRLDSGSPVDIGTTNPFEITELNAGTSYDLQMRSVNSDGVSDWSETTTFTTQEASNPPDSPPTIDDVATTETTAEVSYSEVSSADSYEYRLDSGTPVDIGTTNPFEITGLNAGTSYDLQMRSVNSDGVSNWSETSTFTTQEGSQPPENPPSIDEIDPGTTSAEVSYSEVSGANSYEYRLDGETPVDIGTTNPFTIEELSPGTSYDLQMRAVNSDGNSDWSETATFTTQEANNPPDSPPAINEVTTTETTAEVSYSEVSGADSYEYRLVSGTPINIGTTNPFTIEELNSDTSYDLQMRAVNSNGSSDWSETVTFTTSSESTEIPDEVILEQNYPNPFNPGTTIRYGIPEDSHIRLEVYNLLGKKMMTLVDEQQTAGYHNIFLNAANLSSGIYIYIIESDYGSEAKKFTFIK